MTITKAIPTVWSARIKQELLDAHIFGSPLVTNREYEGDIAGYGATVKIISIGKVAIKAYTKDTAIAQPDALTDAELLLNIDQAFYFNFMVDSIDAAQTRPKLFGEATRTAGWGLRDKSDEFLAGLMVAATVNTIAGPVALTGGAPYDVLVDAAAILTTKNVPSAGRFAVVTPAFHAALVKDDRFLHATAAGDQALREGEVGRAAGFNIFLSNNQPATKVVAGHPMATSFAEQITEVVPYTPDLRFGDALKGLYVFGGKVVYPEALVVITTA